MRGGSPGVQLWDPPGACGGLDALPCGIEKRRVHWILDADIARFPGRIDRDWMLRFPGVRVGDRRLVRLIGRVAVHGRQWKTANRSIRARGGCRVGDIGGPGLPPVRTDLWVGRKWRAGEGRGELIFVWQAHDWVAGFTGPGGGGTAPRRLKRGSSGSDSGCTRGRLA